MTPTFSPSTGSNEDLGGCELGFKLKLYMKPALLRRPRPMPLPPCPGLPHAVIHPSLFHLAMVLLHRVSSFISYDTTWRSASRLHRSSIPGIQRLSEAGRGALGPGDSRPPPLSLSARPWTPTPRSSVCCRITQASPRRPCARTSAFIALSTHPAYMPPIPSIIHVPREVQCSGQEGGRRTNRFASSSSARRRMMCMPRGCGCVRPGGGRRCGCECGCGSGGRCDTGLHGPGVGGGPCSVGSMRACWPGPDAPPGARCEDGGWELRRR
jgi:hypothetical protein